MKPRKSTAREVGRSSATSRCRLCRPTSFFNLIMGTIGALQEFDRVYVLGGGTGSAGPLDSLLVPVLYLFNNAFRYFKMGYASAIAWVIFVVILALALVQLWAQKYWVHYETERNKKGT